MGAWIETNDNLKSHTSALSHPMWVRGLKPADAPLKCKPFYVAPYVGAWIETSFPWESLYVAPVAPYVGAWIETLAGS